ncbi:MULTISPECIES: MbtH family protein [unclassified Serratia (in: enterobacteria)]|uniref:MbtH family protein n=1 Tax=unclassified Serratia (in: enterobacteria) TaxID=2647522 RepID=UPI00046A6333|nr:MULTISPECIES: MbtH family protein [unclassified Serratia (in: enterobacteria)]
METLNPFDDEQQICYVLRNDQQLYSLWPDFSAIPTGWVSVFGPDSREHCVHWLEQHWQDMRPAAQSQA